MPFARGDIKDIPYLKQMVMELLNLLGIYWFKKSSITLNSKIPDINLLSNSYHFFFLFIHLNVFIFSNQKVCKK